MQTQFPESLDARIETLSSFNSEIKLVTLLKGLTDRYQTSNEIRNRIVRSIDSILVPHAATFNSYCDSFVQKGIAASKTVEKIDGWRGYKTLWRLTDKGIEYIQPIVAFSMNYALEDNRSISEIFGSGNSISKRIKILEELGKHRILRVTDLQEKLNSRYPTSRHIEAMHKIGFVEHESVTPNIQGEFKYIATDKDVSKLRSIYKHSPESISDILEIIRNSTKPISKYNIRRKLDNRLSIDSIAGILSGLKKQRFIKPFKWELGKQSEVKLAEDGKAFIKNYLTPIKKVFSDDEKILKHMQEIIDSFDSNDYSLALKLYANVSSRINSCSKEKRQSEIFRIIKNNPGLTRRDLQDKIALTDSSIETYINQMEKQENIVRDKSTIPYKCYSK